MSAFSSHIIELYYHAQAGALNRDEALEWEAFRRDHPGQAAWLDAAGDGQELKGLFVERSPEKREAMSREILDIIMSRIDGEEKVAAVVRPVHRVHFLKTAWFRVAVAVILFFGVGAYIFSLTSETGKEVAIDPSSPKSSDIAPGYNRAMLTLSDGRKVALDSAGAETINDAGVAIRNTEGQLRYSEGEVAAINTMTTPKGGQYQVTLADGTRVWLNAASSITYPTAFTGKTREVEITGEAYFEVAKNKSKPFIVKTNKEQITVIGTSFNVNRYTDEPVGKISLIEGAVQVDGKILQPGQAYSEGRISATNVQQDVAWINGVFNFNQMSLRQAMRQVARWYDVEVVYEPGVPDITFGGKLKRNLNLSEILEGFEAMGIHYELEKDRKRIIIR